MKVLNFGSLNYDNVFGVDHIVLPGETVSAENVQKFPGGKGLNQSISLARAGVKVYHAGCVGIDGDSLCELLKNEGVSLKHLMYDNGLTGQAFIQVGSNGNNSIVIYGGANLKISKGDIDRVLNDFSRDDILITQNEISEVPYLIDKAYQKKMKIVLNPSPFNDTVKNIDLGKVSWLILNEVEAEGYSQNSDIGDFLKTVSEKYPKLKVVLTLGENGSRYLENRNLISQPAFAVKAVDTTAAGDAFTGYFMAGVIDGKTPVECLKEASAASAIAVSTPGAAVSIPNRTQLENALPMFLTKSINPTEQIIQKAERYINQNLKTATLVDLAKNIGYSESYIAKCLKKITGHTFSQILADLRCEKAAELLINTDMSISSIIEEVGYFNKGYFRKRFFDKYGCMPHEYRKERKV